MLQWVFNRIPFFIKKKIVLKVQSDIKDDKQIQISSHHMDVTQQEVEDDTAKQRRSDDSTDILIALTSTIWC